MKKKFLKKKYGIIIVIIGIIICGSYATWNTLDPQYTCAQCHEVNKSYTDWKSSSHADISCTECHGTALSNGFSSLSEKSGMILTHFSSDKTNEDIFLKENQVLDIAARCAECHQAEYAAWKSGAHSTTYSDIFLDPEHNKMEKPYWDCFRCHGMHYDGNINDLMSLEGESDSWTIKDHKQAKRPAMTCLACHQVHGEQDKRIAYESLDKDARSSLMQKTERPATALFVRAVKRHLPSDEIYQTTMQYKDSLVKISDDPNTWLCMQCHSPNSKREIGTEDDKTPIGMYEGMSCLDCHNPHSNGIKNNYKNVHVKSSLVSEKQ